MSTINEHEPGAEDARVVSLDAARAGRAAPAPPPAPPLAADSPAHPEEGAPAARRPVIPEALRTRPTRP